MPTTATLYWQPLPPADPAARCLWRFVDRTPPLPHPRFESPEAVTAWIQETFERRVGECPEGYGPLVEFVDDPPAGGE